MPGFLGRVVGQAREWSRSWLISVGVWLLLCWTVGLAAGAEKPNILFVAIDDQNDWIGCLGGHPRVQTPHIDALAQRGTLFLNAHCQSPLCNPSRTSVLTGRRPESTGIYGLSPWFRDVDDLKTLQTLPRYLQQHGYSTHSAGKIFHGNYGRGPREPEFEQLGPSRGVGIRPPQKLVQTPAAHPLVDWGVFPHQDEEKGDWQLASWTVEQIESGRLEEPFFLSAGFFLPHVPCYVTQDWYDLYAGDAGLLPPFLKDDRADTPRFSWYLHWKLPEPRQQFLRESGQWENLVRSYLASTSFVDAQIGRITQALTDSPYRENTIVVLWSDHGWHLGEKEITGKNSLWDRSTRVPLIFAGPGITGGQRCNRPVELLDIFPTLVELCELPELQQLEGLSLVPQLKNAEAARDRPAMTCHYPGNFGVRTERWRFIQYADGSRELYDMQADANEWHNLAEKPEHAAVVAELAKFVPTDSRPPAPGSAHRILTVDPLGNVIWEGEAITPGDPIPEID